MIGGNLTNHIENWKTITDNFTVLNWITTGVPLEFKVYPEPFEEKNNVFKRKEVLFLDEEIPKLERCGCILKSVRKPHCVSRISTVPKQDGSLRLVTDLRRINQLLIQNKRFVYENIDTALEIVKPNDSLVTLDIKSGFFHCKVDPNYRKYLGFSYRNHYYVWLVTPFGLADSPYFFCKTLRPVIQYLRQEGLRTVCYVDDFLLAETHNLIEQSKKKLITTLESLGFFINYTKSSLTPCTSTKFIGYIIQTDKTKDTVWLHIPKDRINKLKHDIKRVLRSNVVVARALARIAGQIVSMSKVLLPAKLLLRNIYRLLSTKRSWQDKLTVNYSCKEDLKWWLAALHGWNGRSFKKDPSDLLQMTTDASGKSWGGTIVNSNYKAQGFWDRETHNLSANAKEMLAVLLTLKSFLHMVKNKYVQILTDSVTTCAYINFQGGSIKSLDIIARNIWDLAIRNAIRIQAKHLPGRLNTEADQLSRLPSQYEWHLHPSLFRYIDKVLGPHSIDRFASVLTHQLPRYNSLFWDPETEGVDALHQNDWHTEMNFVNPPFRLLPKIVDHIHKTKSEATVIAPYWPAKPWLHQLIRLSVHTPLKLPKTDKVCVPCLDSVPEPCKNRRWSLYAWRVSGKNS